MGTPILEFGAFRFDMGKVPSNVYDVKSAGAPAYKGRDSLPWLLECITTAKVQGGGIVYLPPGWYDLSETPKIPSNITLMGAGIGVTTLRMTAAGQHGLLVDGGQHVRLIGFTLVTADAAAQAGFGVAVHGEAADVLVEQVHVEGFLRGFNVAGGEGAAPGTVKRITLRSCTGVSNETFGFCVDDCDTVTLDDCYARLNHLDGMKLRKKTLNVTIRGGASCQNTGGDGLDAYAGGDTFTVTDFVCDGNSASGILIKAGELNQDDAVNYGQVRNGTLTNVRCRNNTGAGLEFNRSSADAATMPLAANFQVIGGIFSGNGTKGVYIRGRNIRLIGCLIRRNGAEGVYVSATATDIDVTSCTILSNCWPGGVLPGILIAGKRVNVVGGTINGADSDTIAQESDYAALTKTHDYGIRVSVGADDVIIRGVHIINHSTSHPVRVDMTSGRCLVEYPASGGNPEGARYGGPGSTCVRKDAPDGTQAMWIKATGYGVAGWVKAHKLAAAQADSTAVDVAGLAVDFNALLAKLRAAGLMA